jgi:hypothetical protein
MSLFATRSLFQSPRFLAPNSQDVTTFGEVDEDYAHLDRFQTAQQMKREAPDDVGVFEDIGTGLVSGVEGFGRSLVGLADMVLFDAVPDEWSERSFDRPQGMVGGLVEGITQFGLGLVTGGLGVAGKVAQGAKALGAGTKLVSGLKTVSAGATADFISFDEHEARLSDFLVGHDATRNAFTEYLQSDEEDSAFEGRMKNVIEGGILGGAAVALFKAAKVLKKGKQLDGSPESIAAKEAADRELVDTLVDNGMATREGLELVEKAKKLVPESQLRVQAQMASTRLEYGRSLETKADPTSILPKYPKCK